MSEGDVAELTGTLSPYLCHCLVSRQIARHVSRIYDRHLAPTGISAGDLAIFSFVANEKTIAITDLAAMMVLERTTLLRNLRPLIEAGYLETARDPVKKRQHTVSLTKAGEQKRREAQTFWLAAQEEFEQEAGQHNAQDLRGRALHTLGVL
ncbi:MarR family winged helix-turn-helix transcriptional regulator [Croceibacterium ferulae]|uniref:MarR family winged helix-turn-helix transcriptional regulator n=1 Tax=Croceibacterium ferulae TaxID=1854641 RepID=UPI000EAC8164|nr:MarR family winged helix-turn-helix transcriptional regulator [Croceibacterium ferulae]